MRARALAGLALLLVATACGGDSDDGDVGGTPVGPETAIITLVGDDTREELTVELASTPGERSRGLMFREELAENAGMLFLFPGDAQAGFWMRDTYVPLSIAFIAADGTILDVQDMEPETTELHRPGEPYRYALEVNQGWLDDRGFAPGDRVELPDDLPPAR